MEYNVPFQLHIFSTKWKGNGMEKEWKRKGKNIQLIWNQKFDGMEWNWNGKFSGEKIGGLCGGNGKEMERKFL